MTRIKFAVALLAVLALAGCGPPLTTHPLGSTTVSKPDTALLGTWKLTDSNGKAGYYHFLSHSDGTIVAVIVPPNGDASDLLIARLSTTRLGSFTYMNAQLADAQGQPLKDEQPGTAPVLYRIDPRGELTFALMDAKAVKEAVRQGKLKGTIGKSEYGDGDVTITESPEALDKFFASPAAPKLFVAKPLKLRKVD